MSRPPTPTAILDLPDGAARGVLRAGLMAMRVLPAVMPVEPGARDKATREFAARPAATVVFVDASRRGAPGTSLLQLDALLPRDDCRRRVFLARSVTGWRGTRRGS